MAEEDNTGTVESTFSDEKVERLQALQSVVTYMQLTGAQFTVGDFLMAAEAIYDWVATGEQPEFPEALDVE